MPWALGSEVHVDNLHVRQNMRIDGKDEIASNAADIATNTTAIALNTAKVSYPGPPSWEDVTSKPDLQVALTVNNTTSPTFNGVYHVYGGLHLNGSTLTYVPQPIAGIYAPLASPTFIGTISLPSTTSIGDVSSAEIAHLNGVTSSIQTQLNNKQAAGSYQVALETPVVAAASGAGNLTLTSSAGYNTLLTFTPPDLSIYAPLSDPTFITRIQTPYVYNSGQLGLYGGGAGSGADIVLVSYTAKYHANAHYFYNKHGANFPNNSSYGLFVSGANVHQSDDRLKHNETTITDALATVRKLNPKRYQKTFVLKDANFMGELADGYMDEAGFIAQEVLQIPELAYCVKEGLYYDPSTSAQTEETVYYLNYQDLFVHAVAALKELDAKVTSQAAHLGALEARLAAAGL